MEHWRQEVKSKITVEPDTLKEDKPPNKGQTPYKEQNVWSQRVLYSTVLPYNDHKKV